RTKKPESRGTSPREQDMSPRFKYNLKFIGAMWGFGMTWVLIMVLMIGDLTEYKKRKVEGNIPYNFPVVVRIDDRAQIVWGHDLTLNITHYTLVPPWRLKKGRSLG